MNIIKSIVFTLCVISAWFSTDISASAEENFSTVEKSNIAIIGPHKVTYLHLNFDPYTGDLVDEYLFLLDNGTVWRFYWSLYDFNNLSLAVEDSVMIAYSEDSNPHYWMAFGEPLKIVGFQPTIRDDGVFDAVYIHKE